MKKTIILVLCSLGLFLTSCSTEVSKYLYTQDAMSAYDSESYLELNETGYISTSTNNKINISMDSSNAAYSNLRRMIISNDKIPKNAVNIEQMLNYFNYSFVNDSSDALKIFTELANTPWNEESKLAMVAVKAEDFVLESHQGNNFVFLIDVSGSMSSADKLPLLIESFKLLIDSLNENDRVSLVTYAGREEVLLKGVRGSDKAKISRAVSDLYASGATAGKAGIQKAYELAEEYFIVGGNNRVFLATDGDFNVGIRTTGELEEFISEKRKTGVYLSVFGFGKGNIRADIMDTLAQAGNGNYYYIDSILEAHKVFVTQLGGTLNTVAKDCKTQIEFNPNVVEKYRLIGFENKVLSDKEFDDITTDAGEIGAGHTTICLLEIYLHDDAQDDEIFKCIVRYKDPLNDENYELIEACTQISDEPSNDFAFASALVQFALLLRDSAFKGSASYGKVLAILADEQIKNDAYRIEFYDLVVKMRNRQQ